MWDSLKEILGTFVIIAGTIDYGYKALKLFLKLYEKLKSPRRVRRKK